MMISTKGRYALRVMVALASDDSGKYIPLKDIACDQNISEKYLESIIKVLVKNRMVIGLRGKGGGYKLSAESSSYTIGSILKLTEGSLAPVACLKPGSIQCDRADDCPTLPVWRELDRIVDKYLEGITLEDLANGKISLPKQDTNDRQP